VPKNEQEGFHVMHDGSGRDFIGSSPGSNPEGRLVRTQPHAIVKAVSNHLVWSTTGARILVPFSKDGSYFHPQLRRPQTSEYTVGKKGAEQRIASFEEALLYLQGMPVAMWRRPNVNGNSGIVAAIRWDHFPQY
jgi:hypothetical protein